MAILRWQALLCLGLCTYYGTVTAERTEEHLHDQLALDDDTDAQSSELAELASGDSGESGDSGQSNSNSNSNSSSGGKNTWLCVLTALTDDFRCVVELRYLKSSEDHPGSKVCTEGTTRKKKEEPIDLTGPCCGGATQFVTTKDGAIIYDVDENWKMIPKTKQGTCTEEQCLACGAIKKKDNDKNKILPYLQGKLKMQVAAAWEGFTSVVSFKNFGKAAGVLLGAEVGKVVVVGLFFGR